MNKLKLECKEAYERILAPDDSGYPTQLNSLTITDFTFSIATITGTDFYNLHESIILKDAENFEKFWEVLQEFLEKS